MQTLKEAQRKKIVPGVKLFHNKLQRNAHALVNHWRENHEDGYLANWVTQKTAIVHIALCRHLGGTAMPIEIGDLGRVKKACAETVSALQKWARAMKIELHFCQDCCPNEGPEVAGTNAMKDKNRSEESECKVNFWEGRAQETLSTTYERNPKARKRCIQHYGAKCQVCDLNFGDVYGKVAAGYIQVHHLTPVCQIRGKNQVNPIRDLRPICPNCHAVIHLHKASYSIEEVKNWVQRQRARSDVS